MINVIFDLLKENGIESSEADYSNSGYINNC